MDNVEDSIRRAVRDLRGARYAIALTGAGVSTESGVPDFRGPDGIWNKDPEVERRAYQSYSRFLNDPREYWEERLSSTSLLGNLENVMPNPGHYALAALERMGIIKCLITQNVEDLHRRAGSKTILEYHGNVFKLRCTSCDTRYEWDQYDLPRLRKEGQLPPYCRACGGVIKVDVVHFQEPIPTDVAQQSLKEVYKCDLMLICGTSAVVYPFAELPRIARARSHEGAPAVTIVEINAEATPLTEEGISDYLITGKTGEILPCIAEEIEIADSDRFC